MLLFLVFGCEKDEIQQNTESKSNQFSVSIIDAKRIKNNPVIYQRIRELKSIPIFTENKQGKELPRIIEIDTTFARYINYVNSEKHSYTFFITNTSKDIAFENLVFSSTKNNGYQVYLISYSLSQQEMQKMKFGEMVNLSQKVKIAQVEFNGSGEEGVVAHMGTPCGFSVETIWIEIPCPIDGCMDDDYTGGPFPVNVISYEPCGPTYYYHENHEIPGNNEHPPEGPTSSSSSDENDIPTIPVPTIHWQEVVDCVSGHYAPDAPPPFSLNVTSWLMNHFYFSRNLNMFLQDNNCSPEAAAFGELAAEVWYEGGEVDFEEKIIKDSLFVNNPCLNGVYNDLDVSDIASDFLSNFQGQTPVAHLNLTVGVDPNLPNANAVTYPPDNFVIEIMFNPNKLLRPRTSVARTFMHEIIHAEMYRKLLSLAQQGSIPWSEAFINSIKNDFPGLSDYYLRWYYNVPAGQPVGEPQHELMAHDYRETISDFLMQFDPNLTQAQADALAWVGLMGEGPIDNTTGLPPDPTVVWANLPQQTRLNILNTVRSFNNNNPDC